MEALAGLIYEFTGPLVTQTACCPGAVSVSFHGNAKHDRGLRVWHQCCIPEFKHRVPGLPIVYYILLDSIFKDLRKYVYIYFHEGCWLLCLFLLDLYLIWV